MEAKPEPKLVEFDPRKERREEVIDMLERMLEQARAGDLISFAYAATHLDGSTSTAFSGTDDVAKTIGALHMLIYKTTKIALFGSE